MHYLGFIGVPRRYFEMYDSPYMTSAVGMNEFISLAAFIVGAAQFILIYNIINVDITNTFNILNIINY